VFGSGPWTVIFPGLTSTTTILPAGAAAKFSFTFASETAEATTGVADSYSFTVTVHYTDGSTQTAFVKMMEGSATIVNVATTTVSPVIAGHGIAYTATLDVADSGIPLTFFSDPTTANVAADGFSAGFSPAVVTTGSSTSVSSTFTTT